MSLHFEDRLTVQYQIQEMLRVERIFEREAIEAEIETYNPLIPDGTNLKATMMLQYEDPTERSRALAFLIGVEDRVWLRVDGHARYSRLPMRTLCALPRKRPPPFTSCVSSSIRRCGSLSEAAPIFAQASTTIAIAMRSNRSHPRRDALLADLD